ncbi:unnamed protein product [Rhodiola kirilowii]
MPLPMHYHMGNALQLQHQMFMQNIQPHPMQHQGQGMSVPAQMGPHISHQLNQGMSTPYEVQQAGKFALPRKAVVIIHPDTREELKLDKRGDKHGEGGLSSIRSHPNAPAKSQAQAIPSYTSGPSPNFYPNSLNSSSYFVPGTSLSVTNAQGTPSSHASKFNPVSQGPPASGYGTPSFGGKVVISVPAPNELVKTERGHATQVAGSAVPASKKVNSGYTNVSGQPPATGYTFMSGNQSRFDKSDFRKPGRSGNSPGNRGYPSHSRAFGNHDIQSEERQPSFESRALSVPLRTVKDDTITLGPQGGLARGMYNRGAGSSASAPPIDRPLSYVESKRTEAGYKSNNSVTERPTSNSSEDAEGRSAPERYTISATHDRRGGQDRSIHSDRESNNASSFDKTSTTSPEKTFSVERLQDMSLAAIKEFYSAKDEKEMTLCIKELNSPSFYPSMISLWVTDSFERKDMHRDLLTRLLINLSKPPSGILSQQDLLKGFESVLSTLEDTVTDAPRAPEFLCHIVAKSVIENAIPLEDISRILHEGGEERGTLLECGLAADVLGIILEAIQTEKGDSFLDQILSSSKWQQRRNKWKQRRKVEGPKKIEEVHRDAAHERQAQASRLARGPGINSSGRRGPPPDFVSRGSNAMTSPNSHSGSFRGYPSHSRAFGNHDIRSEERQPSFESRALSVPLRTVKDDTITLGPQGGLARGMYNRGAGSSASAPPIDRPLSYVESKRTEAGYKSNNSVTERPTSNSSEDAEGRSAPERYTISATHDRRGGQDRSIHSDRESNNASSFDKTSTTSPEKTFSVERLQDMSLAAIKEFYSAKDEKEMTLCIKELNSPSFYPSMISLWVTDSFERKDMHRDLLTRLLINLSKPPSGILSQQDLLKGFESVLSTLEDTVTDAPRAPEFLCHIVAKSVIENAIPLEDISRILHECGEERGTLLECGLAADVLGIILEAIQTEKGDSFLDQILSSSKWQQRRNKWKQRRKVEGPKKIEEVHRDAAHERQAQASRLACGPGINSSGRRGPPPDFVSRGSNAMPSPNSHSGSFRGYPSHSRAFGNHDIRSEERQPSFESRALSVPLRTVKDDTITLEPQGGLARGMYNRGAGSSASAPPIDRPLSYVESKRTEAGYKSNNSVTERPTSNSSEDAEGRSAPERYTISATHDRRGGQDRSIHSDRESNNASSFDKTSTTSPEKTFSVERLQDISLAAIKEFYSAKDEKEMTLCIKELNSPSFYPSMISVWVTDSFERKDMHRDLLTRLLINLSKPPSGILSQQDLLNGFELVLSTLEDTVTDAPRAPEFLGHIIAKSVIENVIPLADISHRLHEGGVDPGTLLESGLAADVLGIILEAIQTEKGDSFVDQILSSSNLQLEDFRPPGPIKSEKLEKFIK